MNNYTDSKGRKWILVAATAAGIYGWFRPFNRADDGSYDVRKPMASMAKAGA